MPLRIDREPNSAFIQYTMFPLYMPCFLTSLGQAWGSRSASTVNSVTYLRFNIKIKIKKQAHANMRNRILTLANFKQKVGLLELILAAVSTKIESRRPAKYVISLFHHTNHQIFSYVNTSIYVNVNV